MGLEPAPHGWACSQCQWMFPAPDMLGDPDAKAAYDRLASSKFQSHDCAHYGKPAATPSYEDTFTERARKLVVRGFKPRDAVDITKQEILLEQRNDPKVAEKLQIEAENFLRKVKEGLI